MNDSSHTTIRSALNASTGPSREASALPREGGPRAGGPACLSRPANGRCAPERKPAVRIAHAWYQPVKRAGEFLAALVLLALTAPVVLTAAVLVKLTSRGPAFYRQARVGRYGRPFLIVKLRTMVNNCESYSGPCWSVPGDPRITALGRVLRRLHVDELPQLLNVLGGQMGLVGPRPERPEFVPVLEQALPGYRDRLLVRPGVTGLAQVQLPADTDLVSVRRKLAYDLYYIERHNPWLDARILVGTVFKVLYVPFGVSRRLLGFPGGEVIERARDPLPTPPPAPLRNGNAK
jgi:lipopolysaccharide/colanic/teichoic acid biosynthesis glycosyltransferase